MNTDRIINAKGLSELLDAIDEFCRNSFMRDDDTECMQLKTEVETASENDYLMLLASYFVACEDGEEIIEALYEFAGNCKGFVAADEEMTHQVTKAEFETVLDECEDKCALRTCIEDSYALKTAETECYNMYREFALRFKENNINLILPRIDVNTDIRKYISEELGTILYGVLNTKLSKDIIEEEMHRYIPETKQSDKPIKQLFKEYFYNVVLYKDRKPGIYLEFDEHMKRVIVMEFYKRIISRYLQL